MRKLENLYSLFFFRDTLLYTSSYEIKMEKEG